MLTPPGAAVAAGGGGGIPTQGRRFYDAGMLAAPLPENETQRLAELRSLGLLDTPPEERFNHLVRLATKALGVPMAYIALIDADRQYFKAQTGLDCNCTQTDRDVSFCSHTIAHGEPLIIEDAAADERFSDSPLVTGEPYVRFYAGFPLAGPGGHHVATLCVVDSQPRSRDTINLDAMHELARLAERELSVMSVLEAQEALLAARAELDATQRRLADELDAAARYVRSLIPEPLTDGPVLTDWHYLGSSSVGGDLFGYHALPCGRIAVYLFDVSGHGVGASLHGSSVYQTLRRGTLLDVDYTCPESVLEGLNRAFPMEENDGKFVTCWYGVYHPASRTLRYCAAGHHPATLFLPGTDDVTHLGEPGLMLGVDEGFGYRAREVAVMPGARLYLYSDGAFEVRAAPGPGEASDDMLQLDGLAGILARHARGDADRLDGILSDIRRYQGHDRFEDDYSMLEVTFV